MSRRSWGRFLPSGLVVLVGLAGLWSATDGFQALTEEGARRLDIASTPRPVPDLQLQDMTGAKLGLAGENRRPIVLVEFIYTTCPTICQTAGEEFARLRDRIADADLARSVKLVSVSFDPDRDDPEAMRAYGDLHEADGRIWTIARSARADLGEIKRVFGLRVIPDEWGGYQHNAAIHVIEGDRLVGIRDIDDVAGTFDLVERML